jgi:hypothetical protein
MSSRLEIRIIAANKVYLMGPPRQYAAKARDMLSDLITHIREDEGKISEPRALALFETSAEVLIGLRTVFDHHEQKAESAMR